MPDDVSPDVDPRTIDDLITQLFMRQQPSAPNMFAPRGGPTMSESIPPLTQDPRGPRLLYNKNRQPTIYPTSREDDEGALK